MTDTEKITMTLGELHKIMTFDKYLEDNVVCRIIPFQKSKGIPYSFDDCEKICEILLREQKIRSDVKHYGTCKEDDFGCIVDEAINIIPELFKDHLMEELLSKYPDLNFEIDNRGC